MSLELHWIDLVVVAVYFTVVLGLGLGLARRHRGKDSDDYFVAGRRLGWFAVGASLFASNISSEHLTGLAADGFRTGLAVGNYEWGASLVLVLLAVVFVPFYVGSKVRTLPEFLERRFGTGARVYLSLVTILANVLVRISVALYAGALVMETLFGVDLWWAVLLLSVTTLAYTAAGGLSAVVYTDAIQSVVLIGGSALLVAIALGQVGGLDGLMASVDPDMLDMVRPADDPEMPWPGLLFGIPVLGIWYWCTDQVIVQRVLGARSVPQAQLGALFAAALKILPVFLFVLPGLCGRVLFPEVEAKEIFPVMVAKLLPVGIKGAVAASLIAALMSSIDSTLNSTGTLVSLDFYQRKHPEASQASIVRFGRWTTVVVMLFGIGWVNVVQHAESLFQYLQQVQAAISPPITAVFLAGIFMPRANHKGALAALWFGLAVGVAFLLLGEAGLWPVSFLISAGINFALSLAVLLLVSFVTARPEEARLEGTTWASARRRRTIDDRARKRLRALAAGLVATMALLWVAFSGPAGQRAGEWARADGRSRGGSPGEAAPASGAEGSPRTGDAPPDERVPLAFRIREGAIDNAFYRRGLVAAHLVARSGPRPRLVTAFPAGNHGIAAWMRSDGEAHVELAVGAVTEVVRPDGMRGITAEVTANGASQLLVDRVLLTSVRVIRHTADRGELPPELHPSRELGPPAVYRRTSVDGGIRFELMVEPGHGVRISTDERDRLVLEAAGGPPLRLRWTALTDAEPLTPIPRAELLDPDVRADPDLVRALAFLAYREKLLAGSWRFLTYFGRDTLLSLSLLGDAASAALVEAGLGSVLERLDDRGDVAHEEDIGEFAALRRLEEGVAAEDPGALRAPIHDYKMVDDDFLLAPVAARYLLATSEGRRRAGAFLERRAANGESYRALLERNLAFVLEEASRYGSAPEVESLVSLQAGQDVGEWRDSTHGLGGGRVPFNVNASFVPAALRAAAELFESPWLDDSERAKRARALHEAWRSAPNLFRVELPEDEAAAQIGRYAKKAGIPADRALASLAGPLLFPAVALDERGEPIRAMHSDEGFRLLFNEPPPEELDRIAARVLQPFPAGLRTPAGLLVANGAFVRDDERRSWFDRTQYHGAVVWSWQQALWAAGLARQQARTDLPASTRQRLEEASRELWSVIEATRDMRRSELWSWSYGPDSGYEVVPFGLDVAHTTESNAVQLWSTVYLGITPPAATARR